MKKKKAPAPPAISYEKVLKQAVPDATNEQILATLEKMWGVLRDEIDVVKENLIKERVTPFIGRCFRDIEHDRETNAITARSYYKVIRPSGYGVTYLMFRVDNKNCVSVEPEHHSGEYIITNYSPISDIHFNEKWAAMLDKLTQIEEAV
jgi:hypothetical protein